MPQVRRRRSYRKAVIQVRHTYEFDRPMWSVSFGPLPLTIRYCETRDEAKLCAWQLATTLRWLVDQVDGVCIEWFDPS